MSQAGYTAFKLAMTVSPIILTRGIAQGVRPSTTGGTPSNAENEIGSSSGFPGSHTTGGPR